MVVWFVFIFFKYPPKRNSPPNIMMPVIFVINHFKGVFHELYCVGVVILNLYDGIFLWGISWYIFVVNTFVVSCIMVIFYLLFVLYCTTFQLRFVWSILLIFFCTDKRLCPPAAPMKEAKYTDSLRTSIANDAALNMDPDSVYTFFPTST